MAKADAEGDQAQFRAAEGTGAMSALTLTPMGCSTWPRLPRTGGASFRRLRLGHGLPRREDIESVVVVGMGGSGIAGDVLHAVASPLLPVPVTVVKGYECPHFVDETTLVFAVSCSGGTEETIEAASDAALAGAKMVVVTGGGELADAGRGVEGAPSLPSRT